MLEKYLIINYLNEDSSKIKNYNKMCVTMMNDDDKLETETSISYTLTISPDLLKFVTPQVSYIDENGVLVTITGVEELDGKVIENSDYSLPQKEDLKAVLDGFLGESLQEVPITSAVSVDGKRLYQYQREGRQVDLPKRTIRVYSIELEKVLEAIDEL